MKNITGILLTIALIPAIAVSCVLNEGAENQPAGTRSTLTVETVVGGADAHDYIYKVRYIAFDDASTYPVLDINKAVDVTEEDREATEFKSTLEVNSNDDKMLIVIVNEPGEISDLLDRITHPNVLENVIYEMAYSFNPNRTSPNASGIPMTGVKRKIVVSEDNTANVGMSIERAVARVELWLKKEDALTSAEVNTGSWVSLENSHTDGYLVTGTKEDGTRFQTGPEQENNFGHMMTATNPRDGFIWTYTGSSPLVLTDKPQMVCAFYVPERTCSAIADADKLIMNISGVSTSEGIRGVTDHVLNRFSSGGGPEEPITEILRNNVYQVYGNVRSRSVEFEHKVYRWEDAPQGIIIDPQYFLKVNRDNLYLGAVNDYNVISVETNYDISDRGFPKGINADRVEIHYFDKAGNYMFPSDGILHGWLDISMTGVDGDLSRNLTFTATKSLDNVNEGYFAFADISVANITKRIRITRQ